MMVLEDNAGAARMLQAKGYRTDPPFKGFVVIDAAGRPRGAVVLASGDGVEVEVSGVGDRIATRQTLTALFRYVFRAMNAQRAAARCWAWNERSAKALRCLGFIEEGRKRGYGPNGEDLLIFGMLRSECRFLKG